MAEGLHGIDAGGAARRTVGCCDGDRQEDQGGGDEGGGVGGLKTVEHGADEASQGDGCDEAGCDSEDREAGAFAEDHEQDLAGACAEGHADADLAGAAGDVVGHDAVDADAGEDESEDAEPSGEGGEEALLRDAGFDLFGLGADVAEWKVLVDGLDGVAECGEDGGGRELRFDGVGDELLSLAWR